MSADRRGFEEQLAHVAVGTLVMCLDRAGFHNCFLQGVVPFTSERRFIGRARTLRCIPARPDIVDSQRRSPPTPHRVAMDGVAPGQVLVIEARGERGAAVLGDLLAARVKSAGGVAVVTDGCVRDVPALEPLGLPIYASAANATLFGNKHVAMAVDVPIACAGVAVLPGDYVVGDAEGVVVIPESMAAKIASAAAEMEELDNFLLGKIRAGEPLSRAYPPNGEILAEFESFKRRR